MELEDKYIEIMKQKTEKYNNDNETLHIILDDLLLDLLKELGYEKLVKLYTEVSEEMPFWYA